VRICYFYTRIWDEAVRVLPPGAELVDVSGDHTAYWAAICERWGSEDLMFVEHDIAIHDQVVQQFEDCPNLWCLFPYWSNGWFDRCLGCTRFRKEAQVAVSMDEIQQESWGSCWECNVTELPSADDLRRWRAGEHGYEIQGCWRHIDGKMSYSLGTLRGYEPCVHLPPVEHLTQPVPDGVKYKEPQ